MDDELSSHVEDVISRGRQYSRAIFTLDHRLLETKPDDVAAGFEVGSGADVVAFNCLGFKKAIVTNDQGAGYGFLLQGSAERERKILEEILEQHSPIETRLSSLSLMDWLEIKSFSPRLTTMLRMDPSCFDDDKEPGKYLREIIRIYDKLKPNSIVIFSALNDHPLSNEAFLKAKKALDDKKVENKLFVDDGVPEEIQILGQRILVIKK